MAIEYYISSDSDKIYAVLEGTDYDVQIFAEKVILKHLHEIKTKLKKMYISKTSPKNDDEYDEEVGMRIAKDKLLIKYYNDKIQDLLEIATALHNASEEISNFAIKCCNTRANYIRDFYETCGIDTY